MDAEWVYDVDESWTLFLDRDGVINRRLIGDYVTDIESFEILPGVLESLYLSDQKFYRIIVVTNQQGIAKDLMSHEDLHAIHDLLINTVYSANGRIDQIYYSADMDFLDSYTRKPAPGMALEAQKDFPFIDFTKSIMVGDSQSDIDFGRKLGMKTVWIDNQIEYVRGYHLRAESLLSFIRILP